MKKQSKFYIINYKLGSIVWFYFFNGYKYDNVYYFDGI